jgi:uncharacterized delta-60 repeat protein
MATRPIIFTLSGGTAAVGPYNLYANSISVPNLLASNLSLATLQAGYILAVDDAVNSFVFYNTTCNTSQTYSVPPISPTPSITISRTATPSITPTLSPTSTVTPTVTPTATPSSTPVTSDFGSGFDDCVTDSVVVNNLITNVGLFSTYQGVAKDNYVQLNLNGTVNTSFVNYSNGGNIYAIAYDPATERYILAGFIYSWNGGAVAQCMVAVNSTSTRDNTFNTNLGSGFNSNINSVAVQSSSKIIALGIFTSVNGYSRNKIARINADGTVDTSFNYSNNFTDVYQVRVFSNDKIFVCADGTDYNGSAINNGVYLNADGTVYSTIGTGFSGFFNSTLDAKEDSNGKIVVVGAFNTVNGVTSPGIVRLNADGTRDTSFTSPFGTSTIIEGVGIRTDNKIIVVGNFTNRIACLNTDGTIDTTSYSFGSGLDNNNSANVNVLSNGTLIVTGCFTSFNGSTANRIVRINTLNPPGPPPSISTTPSNSITPSITPSGTPGASVTRTPTVTPSNTPPNSVTPSVTPSNTPPNSPSSWYGFNLNPVYDTPYCEISGASITAYKQTSGAITVGDILYDAPNGSPILSGFYTDGGYKYTVQAGGIVSAKEICLPPPSVTPTRTASVTPTRTVTVTPTPTPSPVSTTYYELFGCTNFQYAFTTIIPDDSQQRYVYPVDGNFYTWTGVAITQVSPPPGWNSGIQKTIYYYCP